MAVKALSATGVLYTDRRDFYVDPMLVKLKWANVTPFLTIVANQQTKHPKDPLYKMFQHTNPWETQKFSADGTTTITSDDVESAALSIDGIIGLASAVDDSYEGLEVEIWDSEELTYVGHAIITDATSSSSVKLKSLHGSGSISVTENDVFIIVGNARGVGTDSPEPWQDEIGVVWNTAQVMRTPVSITGDLLAASLRGESKELIRLRLQKNAEHKFQKEMTMLRGFSPVGTNLTSGDTFTDSAGSGSKWRTDGGGNKIRTTMGAISALREYGSDDVTSVNQNLFAINKATFDVEDFYAMSQKIFHVIPGPGIKEMFCGAAMLTYWSTMAAQKKSDWEINVSEMKRDRLGFVFKYLDTPSGILKLIYTPALRGPYERFGLVINRDNMFHAIYRPAEARFGILSSKTANAPDLVKDEWFGDEGIGMTHIYQHQLMWLTTK